MVSCELSSEVLVITTSLKFPAQSFPTPMEEPKKILRAQYLGCLEVQQAVGMNTINDAIEKIGSEPAPDNWTTVNVSISPSMIAVRPSGVSRKRDRRAGINFIDFHI